LVSEIDVQSVELLQEHLLLYMVPMHGILFMTSQSPFTSQGITAYAKFGQTSQKLLGQTTMLIMELEWRMRLVQTCRKANFTYLRGTDWYATNYDDKTNVGRDRSHVNYDGINVYGDEVTTNIKGVAAGLLSAGAISQSQFAALIYRLIIM
jgi:hypothetical protein